MDEPDTVAISLDASEFKVARNNPEGNVQKFTSKMATVPNIAKHRYDTLLRRNRCLGAALIGLLVASSALTAFVIAEKLLRNRELTNIVEEHQHSVNDLSATLNSTLDQLETETMDDVEAKIGAANSVVKDKLDEAFKELEGMFQRMISDEAKNLRREVDTIVQETHASVNETIASSTKELKTDLNDAVKKVHAMATSTIESTANAAHTRLSEMVNKSLTEMQDLIKGTRSAVNVTVDDGVQRSLRVANELITKAIFDLKAEVLYGSVFEFNLNDLHKDSKDTTGMLFSEPQTTMLGGAPVAMRITLSPGRDPVLKVVYGCFRTENDAFYWPLRNLLRFVVLNSANGPLREVIFQPEDVASCQTPSNSTMLPDSAGPKIEYKKADLIAGSALVNNTIRFGISALS